MALAAGRSRVQRRVWLATERRWPDSDGHREIRVTVRRRPPNTVSVCPSGDPARVSGETQDVTSGGGGFIRDGRANCRVHNARPSGQAAELRTADPAVLCAEFAGRKCHPRSGNVTEDTPAMSFQHISALELMNRNNMKMTFTSAQ